jgi:hypothetical protein
MDEFDLQRYLFQHLRISISKEQSEQDHKIRVELSLDGNVISSDWTYSKSWNEE